MGQLATQAQNAQMQTMNPQKNMKSLLERSWPRIAAVIGNNLSPQRLYQMYVSTINREPQLANCHQEYVNRLRDADNSFESWKKNGGKQNG